MGHQVKTRLSLLSIVALVGCYDTFTRDDLDGLKDDAIVL